MNLFILAGLFSSLSFANVASTKIVVETIAENDAIVRAVDLDQEKVIQDWLKKGHSSFSKVKNKIQESLLDRAASQGSERVFGVLLGNMENNQSQLRKFWTDSRGTPILLGLVALAVPSQPQSKKYERMVERLLEKHLELVSAQDHAYIGDGRTALHQAAANGNLEILKSLIAHGAQINSVNANGETPLHFAARFGKLEALKALISDGAKLDEKSKYTKATPLLTAAENGHEAIIRELLDAGAKKSEKDAFGKTAPERYKEYVASYYQTRAPQKN
jgi:ankyrin repeat protein